MFCDAIKMLISGTSELYPGFYLLRLGESCHYFIQGEASWIFDPGTELHVAHLEKRLSELGQNWKGSVHILPTHLHTERVAGVPHLRSLCPSSVVYLSPAMREHIDSPQFVETLRTDGMALRTKHPKLNALPLSSDEEIRAAFLQEHLISDSDCLRCSDHLTLRVLTSSLHTAHSTYFYVEPCRFLIVDEGLGYYGGRGLSAPGADNDLFGLAAFIQKVIDLDVAGICFPFIGTITGELVTRFLHAMRDGVQEMLAEVSRARKSGMPVLEVQEEVWTQFYGLSSSDPFQKYALERSFRAVWSQIK